MNDYGSQPHTATAGGQQPTIRIRNEHSHTLKDAWRLSSSTVEITAPYWDGDPAAISELLQVLQRIAFNAGQDEAVRRNQEGHMEDRHAD